MKKIYNPIPGQILRVYCKSKLVWHYGIYAGNGYVIDSAPRKGVAIRHWNEFCEGEKVEAVPYELGDFPPEIILSRAKSFVGKVKYDVLQWNCEQFVNVCRNGKKKSKQIANATTGFLGLAAIVTLVTLASDKRS